MDKKEAYEFRELYIKYKEMLKSRGDKPRFWT